MEKRERVVVIGAGAAGIAAAYVLQSKFDVMLLDKNDYIGGHTNTIVIKDGPDKGLAIDTGFIVLNDRTYPTLHRLFKEWEVPVRDSDMSFGFFCEESGLQYAGTGFAGLFAEPRNIANPRHWAMLRDIARFGLRALKDLEAGRMDGVTLGQYVEGRFSRAFIEDYLIPMGAAIWSTDPAAMLLFPAATLARFFKNHGLLNLLDRPQWQTVAGGSQTYVRAFLKRFNGEVRPGSAVERLERHKGTIRVQLKNGASVSGDYAVVACHADEALALLADPTSDEKKILGAWRYQKNKTVLHTDTRVLAPKRRAWASWNYTRECRRGLAQPPLSMTYHMNRLQGLAACREYCVTLNRSGPIDKDRVIAEFLYTHPTYTFESISAQRGLPAIQGPRRTYFCGSYFGYGFHEDAVKSGLEAAKLLGAV